MLGPQQGSSASEGTHRQTRRTLVMHCDYTSSRGSVRACLQLTRPHAAPCSAHNAVHMLPHTAGTFSRPANLQVQRLRTNPGLEQQDNNTADLLQCMPSISPQRCQSSAPSHRGPDKLLHPPGDPNLGSTPATCPASTHAAARVRPLSQLLLVCADGGPTPTPPIRDLDPGQDPAADVHPRSMAPRRWLSNARPACR